MSSVLGKKPKKKKSWKKQQRELSAQYIREAKNSAIRSTVSLVICILMIIISCLLWFLQ